jgi:hypothetical protein
VSAGGATEAGTRAVFGAFDVVECVAALACEKIFDRCSGGLGHGEDHRKGYEDCPRRADFRKRMSADVSEMLELTLVFVRIDTGVGRSGTSAATS